MSKKEEQSKKNENKKDEKRIDSILKDIQSKFGEESIMKLGDKKEGAIAIISTGSLSLDIATGVGGIPRGRIIEIFGPESSGKTTLALNVAAEAQKAGGVAAFIDAEHALDPNYAQKIGVQVNDLLISQPDSGEQALQILESLVKSGAVDVAVVDSVAALTPRAEIDGEIGDHHIGLQARLMSQALRKLTSIAANSKTSIIFINQIRSQIGVFFGNPETTPGGKALKFYSSVRLEVRRAAQIKKGEEIVGNRVKIKVVKNKVAPPFRTAEFDIMFSEGISKEADVINLGVNYGLVKKNGASYSYGDIKLGHGYDSAKVYLKENKKIAVELTKEIMKQQTQIS